MRSIDPTQHRLLLIKLQQALVKGRRTNEMNDPSAGDLSHQQENAETMELLEIRARMDSLYDLYRTKKEEILLLSEKYSQLQRQVRIKLRKQEILNRKYNGIVNKAKRIREQIKKSSLDPII